MSTFSINRYGLSRCPILSTHNSEVPTNFLMQDGLKFLPSSHNVPKTPDLNKLSSEMGI